MVKKIIIGLLISFAIVCSFWYYQETHKSVECWWGVMYPTLSFVAIEDEDKGIATSSLNANYFVTEKEKPIKVKFAIIEWFNKNFK